MKKIFEENKDLQEEVRTGQEKLRVSSSHNQKILNELEEYKMRIGSNDKDTEEFKKKIQALLKQNASLDSEMKNAQDALRLSATQQSKFGQ